MIDLLKNKINKLSTAEDKYNLLREELQILILSKLDSLGYFKNIAFVGGTALRILYKIRRFSEDLDFSLVDNHGYDFENLMEELNNSLTKTGLRTRIKTRKKIGAVRSAFIKFQDLLYELDLSPLPDQNIQIKFEIDENPPLGFETQLTIYNGDLVVAINHFDQPSLFAGKLHAILSRTYVKGRDYFDLLWFLANQIEPNINLLSKALEQFTQKPVELNSRDLKTLLINKIKTVQFEVVIKDLEPFIIDRDSLNHYNQSNLIDLIEKQL